MATGQKKPTTKAKKETTKEPTKARAPRRRRAPTREAVAERAYELSLVHGDGDDVSHWLQAERELAAS